MTVLSSTQLYNSFTAYANGTIAFSVSGLELSEPNLKLQFSVTSYGNGTFPVEFITTLLPAVSASNTLSSSYSNSLQVVSYNTNQNSLLTISWSKLAGITNVLVAFLALFGVLIAIVLFLFIWYWVTHRETISTEEMEFMHNRIVLFLLFVLLLIIAILAFSIVT